MLPGKLRFHFAISLSLLASGKNLAKLCCALHYPSIRHFCQAWLHQTPLYPIKSGSEWSRFRLSKDLHEPFRQRFFRLLSLLGCKHTSTVPKADVGLCICKFDQPSPGILPLNVQGCHGGISIQRCARRVIESRSCSSRGQELA